jgi:NAD(P)-dependent dehydrogenase (short-subunit alcohol dehydrogenase family)
MTHKALDGRRALITGGGRGIGRAIALAMAREGAAVVVLARTSEQVGEVAAQIAGMGVHSLAVQADLSHRGELEAGIDRALAEWGGIDILVNNAGILGPVGRTHELDPEAWMQTLQVNLFASFRCAQLILPGMIERQRGKIINLSGGGAVSPRPRFSAYAAAKAGLVRFTETLAAEVAEHAIDVNAIAPGAIHTNMVDEILNAGAAAGEEDRAEAQQLVDAGGQDPDRAAALAVFLASSRSDGLSGRLISAMWDDWEHLDIAAVMGSEQFTVRRLK